MMRWVALIACHGGDGIIVRYTTMFFDYLGQHIILIKDFLYVGMDYRGDTDIPLPIRTQWSDLGENFLHFDIFINL